MRSVLPRGTACSDGECVPSSCGNAATVLGIVTPTADLDTVNWKAFPSGNFFEQFDDLPTPDGLVSYIMDDTLLTRSRVLFTHSGIQVPDSVKIVSLYSEVEAAIGSSARQLGPFFFSVSVNGQAFDSVEYLAYPDFGMAGWGWNENPATGAKWKAEDLATLAFGIAHEAPPGATTNPLLVTQLTLEVCVTHW